MNKFIKNIRFDKKIILIVISAVAAFAVLLVIIYFADGKKYDGGQFNLRDKENENSYITELPAEDKILPDDEPRESPDDADELAESDENAENPVNRPPIKAKRVYRDKYDSLRAQYNDNEDIIGIIKIPGSVVYYPVAHHLSDNDYYLGRNLLKQRSSAGSICMDYENSVERYDPNTILYGHQMYSDSMFHSINYYRDEEYFYNHRYIIFNTIYEDNVWEVFSFFETHISFYYIQVFFNSEKDFLSLAAEINKKSMYGTGIEIKEGDRILTLSTCTNLDPDTRYVLCARLVKNKDDIPEDILREMTNAVEDFQ